MTDTNPYQPEWDAVVRAVNAFIGDVQEYAGDQNRRMFGAAPADNGRVSAALLKLVTKAQALGRVDEHGRLCIACYKNDGTCLRRPALLALAEAALQATPTVIG